MTAGGLKVGLVYKDNISPSLHILIIDLKWGGGVNLQKGFYFGAREKSASRGLDNFGGLKDNFKRRLFW